MSILLSVLGGGRGSKTRNVLTSRNSNILIYKNRDFLTSAMLHRRLNKLLQTDANYAVLNKASSLYWQRQEIVNLRIYFRQINQIFFYSLLVVFLNILKGFEHFKNWTFAPSKLNEISLLLINYLSQPKISGLFLKNVQDPRSQDPAF